MPGIDEFDGRVTLLNEDHAGAVARVADAPQLAVPEALHGRAQCVPCCPVLLLAQFVHDDAGCRLASRVLRGADLVDGECTAFDVFLAVRVAHFGGRGLQGGDRGGLFLDGLRLRVAPEFHAVPWFSGDVEVLRGADDFKSQRGHAVGVALAVHVQPP